MVQDRRALDAIDGSATPETNVTTGVDERTPTLDERHA